VRRSRSHRDGEAASAAAVTAAAATAAPAPAFTPWWHSYPLQPGEAGYWRIGALSFWVERREREWRLAWRHAAEPDAAGAPPPTPEEQLEVRAPLPAAELPEGLQVARFAAGATTAELRLRPGLADRRVVARPEAPFHLLGGERVTFYVATPVWVHLQTSDGKPLLALPTQVLPETWLGPSTMVGEVCYASRTKARVDLAELPRWPHLAVTRVTLHNRPPEALLLERVSLPAPSLGVWWHPRLGLWTQAVSVEREEDGTLATMRLGAGPPEEVHGAEPLAPPAEPESRPALVRALGALLG
jgi:hypothetical protein